MLNVPAVIDTIAYSTNIEQSLKADGDVRKKYIRIEFPNREHRDLTNDDIVQESFSFTESVCSSDVLKFGLSEAAEVTFETVGIPNITGMEISVRYEIDVSDLDAEYNCAGRYISDTDNCNRTIGSYEVTRGVYSIPIGTFKVIEAERSKSDMTHRSVRAITTVFETNDDMTPYEQWKLGQMHRTKYFYMVLPQYVDCQVNKIGTDNGYVINGDIGEFTFNNTAQDACYKGKINLSSTNVDTEISRGYIELPGGTYSYSSLCLSLTCSYTSNEVDVDSLDGSTYRMYPYAYSPVIKNDESESNPKNRVYGVDTYYNYDYHEYNVPYISEETYKPERALNKFRQYLYDFLYTYSFRGDNVYRHLAEQLLSSENPNIIQDNFEDFFYNKVASFGIKYTKNTSTKRGSYFSIRDNSFMCLYDKGLNDKDTTTGGITVRGRFIIPTLITVYRRFYSSATEKTPDIETELLTIPILGKYVFNELQGGSSFQFPFINRIYERNGLGLPEEIKLRFKHTLENSANKTFKYSFENAFTMRDLINGYLEINAKFGHQRRDGKYEYLGLPSETTRQITQNEYEKLYYDEYDIDDIRWVLYKYRNKDDKEIPMSYDLKTKGSSVYDMSDNEIFAALDEDEKITDKKLVEKINKILSTYFKPNMHVIHYYPVELTMHAKPYLEAGDRYEIVNNGVTFHTYNLNLTMQGIQIPTEEITSTTGQIITGADLSVDMDEDDDT